MKPGLYLIRLPEAGGMFYKGLRGGAHTWVFHRHEAAVYDSSSLTRQIKRLNASGYAIEVQPLNS